MMCDFRDLKPVVRKICKELDGKTIIANDSKNIIFSKFD